MKTAAIVLAAGGASRFGSAKQLLEFEGETLIDRACRIAIEAGCDPILRVLGANADKILEHPTADHVLTLVHLGWEEGMGSSIALGIQELQRKHSDLQAVFVILCDQPLIHAGFLIEMLEKVSVPGISIVLTEHGQATGPPALFTQIHFSELASLKGDEGARLITKLHPQSIMKLSNPDARWDIDSPDVWAEFKKRVL